MIQILLKILVFKKEHLKAYLKTLKSLPNYGKKISSLINKKFDSEPVYGDHDKCIKTKIKSYRD